MHPSYPTTKKALIQLLIESQHLFKSPMPKATSEDVLDMLRRLECVQIDSVASVTKNQHLVMSARLKDYQSSQLTDLLQEGAVFEYAANAMCILPVEDYPLLKPIRDYRQARLQPVLHQLKDVTHRILQRLTIEGALPSRAFLSANRVHGYWDNEQPKTKETSHALNVLFDAGILQIVKREGSERFFDLTQHVIPKRFLDTSERLSMHEAKQSLLDKYMRSYRIFDAQNARFGWYKMNATERKVEIARLLNEDKIIPLAIEGVKRQYYILTEDLDRLKAIESTAQSYRSSAMVFLPPLDNLLWSRNRLEDLFAFNYRWEIYVPTAKRRYGPYAMPILWKDRFIGRIDPVLVKKEQHLTVRLLQIEPHVPITKTLIKQLNRSINTFAKTHGAKSITIEKVEPKTVDPCLILD
ncbi:hypothetical protein GCM10011391_08000 [Pullulanibacillus camelliae]|uniref:Winged helix-turn-helix domain-containing protein n=1 Tax=Pullulanibacillus camelliae TaxID=1707096 RepID=A0A8J2YG07_9BACL|nr:crosslink repair DNA glycosylase YcaQ family protein [Pullulanibacillus camelliae]GGE31737.1 hypothetical protein GCM10011391_08000 [Pullulanibacillus camelliae]